MMNVRKQTLGNNNDKLKVIFKAITPSKLEAQWLGRTLGN